VRVQHGINCRREEGQISEPGGTAIREKASNLLHLSRRKAVSFANLKTFVPFYLLHKGTPTAPAAEGRSNKRAISRSSRPNVCFAAAHRSMVCFPRFDCVSVLET